MPEHSEHPVLLEDLANNLQRLSASLPPDGWNPDAPGFYLHRQESGALEISMGAVKPGELVRATTIQLPCHHAPEETTATRASGDRGSEREQAVTSPKESSGGEKRASVAVKPAFWKRLCPFRRYLIPLTPPPRPFPQHTSTSSLIHRDNRFDTRREGTSPEKRHIGKERKSRELSVWIKIEITRTNIC